MSQAYKTQKEDFVSGLSGGSALEVNYVTAIGPTTYLLWSVLQSRQSFFVQYGGSQMIADYMLNVVCLLFAMTIYASSPLLLNLLLFVPAVTLYVLPAQVPVSQRTVKPLPAKSVSSVKPDLLPVRPYITAYRGGMMIITCLAILAVDFKIFPRRFAKVETWGTSLMDMGVGSFVFSAGLVAARPVLQARFAGRKASTLQSIRASLRVSMPLVILGFIRLYSVKGLDYAEHVTEYGVHWNFFFTLAFLPPFAALIQPLLLEIHPVTVVVLLGGAYQGLLDMTDLKAFILTAPRTTLLNQNREGIFSFFGYLSIFIAGQSLGLVILPRQGVTSSDMPSPREQRIHTTMLLAGYSLIWSGLYLGATSYGYGLGLQVSRRLANFPYVVWVAAFNCAQLLSFFVVETVMFPRVSSAKDNDTESQECNMATSQVLRAFNRNGLVIFLIANLLTGLVNLTLDTIEMDRISSLAVLISYSCILTAIALALDHRNISIKI